MTPPPPATTATRATPATPVVPAAPTTAGTAGTAGAVGPAPQSRRRSGFVTLGMVGTLALALSGCASSGGGNPPSRCVDPSTLKVLDSHSCTGGGTSAAAGRWYYCGSGSTTAIGGTFDKAATKRGGFGCPSGSSGSGGG
ncbi:hypothetical protein [Kitasatospora sp. NPDC090091]|uniref:hypothetical protein n=1 Tax=Kitasatospora sp. NPDC090091 TaxID=3364081 RepID=UPI0038285000